MEFRELNDGEMMVNGSLSGICFLLGLGLVGLGLMVGG